MSKRLIGFLSLVLLSCACIGAQVGQILAQSTDENFDTDALKQVITQTVAMHVGDEYDVQTLADDVKALMKTGKFTNIRPKITKGADGKMVITYIVSTKPIVRKIVFQGVTQLKEGFLRKEIKQGIGTPLDEKALAESRSGILDKYRNAGYFGTEIHTVQESLGEGNVQIVIVVKEEVRHKLKGVYFEGNTVFEQGELRSEIQTQRQWWRYIFRLGNYFNKEMLPLDKDKLQKLYFEKGYLDFAVKEIRIEELEDEPKWARVVFVLDEGRPYTVRSVEVTGAEKYSNDALLKKVQTKAGDVYDSSREDADKYLLRADYEKDGYIDLQVWPTHEKNEADHSVAVVYHVSEGKPARIRNIMIAGNEQTQDRVIRRELAIGPGDKGDQNLIRISRSRLMNLGYFDSVEILPVTTDEPDMRDLRIELKERSTGMLSMGAGFSTEDSAIVFAEFTETNFDLMRLFDWPPKGAGQRLRSRIQLGNDSSNFLLSLTEPWFLDRRLELQTEFFYRTRFEDEYDQRSYGAGQMLSWPVEFRIPGFEHVENWRLGVGYRFEHFKISNVDYHDPDTAMEEGDFVRGHILYDERCSEWANRFILRASRDTRDAYRFPKSGSIFTLNTEFVTKALGSYEDYVRMDVGFTQYAPLVRDLILKLNVEYSTGFGADDIGIFDRYFAGGIGTIRGFKRRDVSPRDCYDDPLGGRSYFAGTVEILKPVRDFMFASVFVDCGNVWWDESEIDLGDLNYSVGVGIQFKSLPVALYYGYPISTTYDHLKNRSGRLHFNIGLSY